MKATAQRGPRGSGAWRAAMRTSLACVAALAVGCAQPVSEGPVGPAGVRGEQGPQGPAGERGPRGEAGYTGLVWVDATGALVGPNADRPVYIDADGILWPVDMETGALAPVLLASPTSVFYETDDCSGSAWFTNVPAPGRACRVVGAHPSVPGLLVRARGAALQRTTVRSWYNNGERADGGTYDVCIPLDFPQSVAGVAATGMEPLGAPSLHFVGPLELRAN